MSILRSHLKNGYVIAVANQKGGVGKTTTAINFSIGLVNEKPVIIFEKEIDGKVTVVAYASDKHFDLVVQPMYAKKRGSLALPTDANAPVITSETNEGTASATDAISETSENVKQKFSMDDSVV